MEKIKVILYGHNKVRHLEVKLDSPGQSYILLKPGEIYHRSASGDNHLIVSSSGWLFGLIPRSRTELVEFWAEGTPFPPSLREGLEKGWRGSMTHANAIKLQRKVKLERKVHSEERHGSAFGLLSGILPRLTPANYLTYALFIAAGAMGLWGLILQGQMQGG